MKGRKKLWEKVCRESTELFELQHSGAKREEERMHRGRERRRSYKGCTGERRKKIKGKKFFLLFLTFFFPRKKGTEFKNKRA